MDPFDHLDSLGMFRMKPGLSRIRAVLHRLGDPQDSVPSVLVSGTNGKGSTVIVARNILKEMGFSTLLYTSPHLISVSERISIDGENVAIEELRELLRRVMEADRDIFQDGEGVSYFEAITAAAFLCAKERDVDILISEVGLGGRFDATNVLEPRAVGITSISLDHTEFLGEDIISIAREKMGIMRASTPCVVGPLLGADREGIWALRKIADLCSENGSPLIAIEKEENFDLAERTLCERALPGHRTIRVRSTTGPEGTDIDLSTEGGGNDQGFESILGLMDPLLSGSFHAPVMGEHQGWNVACGIVLALLAFPSARAQCRARGGEVGSLEELAEGSLKDLDLASCLDGMRDSIRLGLEKTHIPGRLERRRYRGNDVIIDGSHNMEAAAGLASLLKNTFPGRRSRFLISMMKDKSPAEYTSMLRGMEEEIYLTRVPEARGMDLMRLLREAVLGFGGDSNIHIRRDVNVAISSWLKGLDKDGPGVACGTFYLYRYLNDRIRGQ